MGIAAIITGMSLLWPGLMFFLPKDLAQKLKPVGKFLNAIANTPGGIKL